MLLVPAARPPEAASMNRNQLSAPGGERLQRSQTRCEADDRAAAPRSEAYPASQGSKSSVPWMIPQSAMSSRGSLRCASSGRLLVDPVKKHGHIHPLMKGIQHLRD